MAWTTPKTWASGYVVLAADLNTHLRDNLNVTAPAVMTTAGDIIYASGANTPARLAKSTTSTQYLANTGTSNVPAWNEVALATGVSGTLPVGNGGTGATTLTANGALVGNGSSAIAAVDMSTKGGLLAGDGSGNPSVLAVGGTADHVLTVDSGETTGMKWAAVAGGLSAASQAEMEAASSNTVAATPGRTQNHPGVCKIWVSNNATGTTAEASYNLASTARPGNGRYTITVATDFSSAEYAIVLGLQLNDPGSIQTPNDSDGNAATAGAFEVMTANDAGTRTSYEHSAAAFGDQ
jgi:hypothetical protein